MLGQIVSQAAKIGLCFYLPIIDGISYAAITFSKAVESAEALRIIPMDDTYKDDIPTMMALCSVPVLAMLGVIALTMHENSDFYHANAKQMPTWQGLSNYFKNFPLEISVTLLAAAIDAVIDCMNFDSMGEQLGQSVSPKVLFVVGCSVALQFGLLNGTALIKRVRDGDDTYDYRRKISGRFRFVEIKLVQMVANIFPAISATIVGCLAVTEVHELARETLFLTQPEDIANRAAWVPAVCLGLVYAGYRRTLYGCDYKRWIEQKAWEMGEYGFTNFMRHNFIPDFSQKKRMPVMLLAFLISASAIPIDYGSLDEVCFTILFGRPPTMPLNSEVYVESYESLFPSSIKNTIFIMLGLIFMGELYAVEGLRFIDLLCGVNSPNTDQHTEGLPKRYEIQKFLADMLALASVSMMTLLLDLCFIPDNHTFSLQQELLSSLFLATAVGFKECVYTIWKMVNLHRQLSSYTSQFFPAVMPGENISEQALQEMLQKLTPITQGIHERDQEQLDRILQINVIKQKIERSYSSKSQIFARIGAVMLASAVLYFLLELVVFNEFFEQVNGEEGKRADATHVLAVLAAATLGVWGVRIGRWLYNVASNTCAGVASCGDSRSHAGYQKLPQDEEVSMEASGVTSVPRQSLLACLCGFFSGNNSDDRQRLLDEDEDEQESSKQQYALG